MLEIKIDGLDDAMRKLKRLGENARALTGAREIPASELFGPDFMRRHATVPTFDALLVAGGYRVESAADFAAIPDAEWDQVVRAHTSFASWQQMCETGASEYAARTLEAGL